ncbi:MAG TPA: response regulator [Pirellulales bacterium]|jgi:CheY-like chemotaxis protein|nr:response regulator [Pirellulales bacterium]
MADSKPRLLVVDDDADTCANLSDILTDVGYQVDAAYDGTSALELIKQHAYDAAILDLKMPGMDGIELYRRIKHLQADTVAIVVTAYASSNAASEALAAGAWRILSKPVELPKLLALLDEAVEQPLLLIVDDDRDLCQSLWNLLRERGYRVALAHDPPEAAARLGQRSHHVVLIDMKLPHGGGADVFRLVRQANPQARTVLITGLCGEMEQLVEQTLASGADAACYKPFDIPRLLEILRSLTTHG